MKIIIHNYNAHTWTRKVSLLKRISTYLFNRKNYKKEETFYSYQITCEPNKYLHKYFCVGDHLLVRDLQFMVRAVDPVMNLHQIGNTNTELVLDAIEDVIVLGNTYKEN